MDTSRVEPGQAGTTFKFTCVPKYVVVDPESVTNRSGVRYATIEPGPPVTAPLGYATIELRRAPSCGLVAAAPRRQATTSRRGRARTARRSGSSSRDGPSGSSEPPLHRRPLTPDERRWLKAKVDARRREVVRATEKVERSLEREWRRAS
jgi:hypothetical protein